MEIIFRSQENKDKEKLQQFASILPKTSPKIFACCAQTNASPPPASANTRFSFFNAAPIAAAVIPVEELQVAENDQPVPVKKGWWHHCSIS